VHEVEISPLALGDFECLLGQGIFSSLFAVVLIFGIEVELSIGRLRSLEREGHSSSGSSSELRICGGVELGY